MIYPDDAKAFSSMMDVTWQSLHRAAVDKQTKQYWFGKLQHLPLGDVEQAFDNWLMTSGKELPTIKDILNATRPKESFYTAIGKVKNEEVNQEGLKKIEQFVAKNLKPKTDYREWAKRIMRNPEKFPEASVLAAENALNMAVAE